MDHEDSEEYDRKKATNVGDAAEDTFNPIIMLDFIHEILSVPPLVTNRKGEEF